MSTLQSANSKASDTLAAATETGVPSAAPSARAAAAGPPEIVKNAQHSSLSASTSGAGANASGARRIALCGLIASPVCRQSRDRTIQGAARRTAQALYWVRQVAVESNDVVGCPGSPSAMQGPSFGTLRSGIGRGRQGRHHHESEAARLSAPRRRFGSGLWGGCGSRSHSGRVGSLGLAGHSGELPRLQHRCLGCCGG